MTINEKSLIRQLMQSPQFPVLENLSKELIDKIAYDSKLRDTEWETLKATVFDAGQIKGITRFIQELYNSQLIEK